MNQPNESVSLTREQFQDMLEKTPEEFLKNYQFFLPGIVNPKQTISDVDGFPFDPAKRKNAESNLYREDLQRECWLKFNRNPQLNTAVRGQTGRIVGFGFETTSEVWSIQETIEEIEEDPRNQLYNNLHKFLSRSDIEGELFLCLTLHQDGFVEVDFIDPSCVTPFHRGDNNNDGIVYHPTKKWFPLLFDIDDGEGFKAQIPSINLARYPQMISLIDNSYISTPALSMSKSNKGCYRNLNGFCKFMVYWNKGLLTDRAVSYLRTSIEWINYYEELKRYEIEHKKSSGSYVWAVQIEDVGSFKRWLSLSDEDRKKTGIMAPKEPGSTLVMPPGMKLIVVNPNIPNLSGQDTDVLDMVSSGLNEPNDVMTGRSSGTFASVKASRGPMSDRISDEVAYFERFWRFEFWGGVFFLKSKVTNFPEKFPVLEAIEWGANKEAIFKTIYKKPEKLVEFSFPMSESTDVEALARAYLGVKHGPMPDSIGIPARGIAKRMGFGSYGRNRLRKYAEERNYPPLIYSVDGETLQEVMEGEKPKDVNDEQGIQTDESPSPDSSTETESGDDGQDQVSEGRRGRPAGS